MAYVRTNRIPGDLITTEKLNNAEAGIEAAVTKTVTAINLTTNSSGRITGGTGAMSDESLFEITINLTEV